MIVPTEEKAWIQSSNYGTCLEGKGHLTAEAISNKASWKGTLPQKREELKKKRKERRKSSMGEKVTMVLAHISKHVSESVPPANTGNFSKLLRR